MDYNEKTFVAKTKVVSTLVVLALVVFMLVFISSTGSIEHLDAEVDSLVEKEEYAQIRKLMIEGYFTDRTGTPITEGSSPGKAATIIEPDLYSVLIGYNSQRYGCSGLRADSEIQSYIFNANKEDGYVGSTITLSVDTELQRFCYELLGDNVGSIVVIDNNTGDILASVSKNSLETDFDVNEIDERFDEYNKTAGLYMNRCMLASDPPGSVGKIYTACALVENGEVNYVHNDIGKYRGINNAGGYHYGAVGITKSMVKSINTYYASAADYLGAEKMLGMFQSFGFNEELHMGMGLGTLKSTVCITEEYHLRQCGFGQGTLRVSPMHLTLSLAGILNNGDMLRPNIVLAVKPTVSAEKMDAEEEASNGSNEGEVLYTRTVEVVKEDVISQKTADKLKQMLADTAESYGLKSASGTIYAKTGTAEVTSSEGKGKYHIYLLFGSEHHSACISIDRTDLGSGYLKPLAQELIDFLDHME